MKLGSKVAELENAPYKIGDHVAGFTHGGVYKDRGAYAEYVQATYNLCWKVPEGSLTHEQSHVPRSRPQARTPHTTSSNLENMYL